MKENQRTYLKTILVALVICFIAEMIGPFSFHVKDIEVKITTMIWAVGIGILLSPMLLGKVLPFLKKIVDEKEINASPYLLSLTLYPLSILFGISAGPKVGIVLTSGPALILQEFGNLATMFIALPLAMYIGLGRSSVGATFSLCRDTALGLIGDKYGLNSKEGIGTLGVYITGSVVGSIYYALLVQLGLKLGFHPYTLAMGSGMGSASMMTAATVALSEAVSPDLVDQVLAYSATSGLLTAVTGVYMEIFIALPLANRYYKTLNGPMLEISKWHRKEVGVENGK